MLILTRRFRESFILTLNGVRVEVVLLGRHHESNNQFRIGIQAPKEVKIFRSELEEYNDPSHPFVDRGTAECENPHRSGNSAAPTTLKG